jgi:hypothetical protein
MMWKSEASKRGFAMNSTIYRGYDIQGPSATGRYYIYKDGKEIYSMTATEEQVCDWIDRDKRKNNAKA